MAGRRFEKIYSQGIGGGIDIWLDRATGVQYLYIGSGSGGGLTPLLNREGQPLIWEGPLDADE